ncbi:putative electron transfer flavoprotein subunit [Entomortierella lignicola]|nr:putative electron transfer flavoprotein subunit [Entomortierella lignicola]
MSLAETAPVVAAALSDPSAPSSTTDSNSIVKPSHENEHESITSIATIAASSTSLSTSVSLSAATTSTESSIITTAPNQPEQKEAEEQKPLSTSLSIEDAHMIAAPLSPVVAPLSPSPSLSLSSPTSSSTSASSFPAMSSVKTKDTGAIGNESNEHLTTERSTPTPTSLSPSVSTVASTIITIDKGHPIPTSNALSSVLRSRLSTSAPLSSLSSATPTTIISPKPYSSSSHSTTSLSSMSKSDLTHRPLGSGVNSSNFSMSSSSPVDIHIASPKAHPQFSTHSKPDHQSTLSDFNDEEYEDEYEEGDEYEVVDVGDDIESDIELEDSELGMDVEPKPLNEDEEMMDVSSRPKSPLVLPTVQSSSESSTSVPTKERLVSPNSPSTTANRDRSPVPDSTLMTPAPQLTAKVEPSGSSSVNSNSGNGFKKEFKAGVTATSCANCGTTTTPLWRRASDGQTICNACGLYFKARNLKRPRWLKRNMGLKKGDNLTETEGTDDSASAITPGVDSSSNTSDMSSSEIVRISEKSQTNGETLAKTESGEPCPGDGSCNGTGGSHTCSGCPSYNQQQSGRQHLVCANCRTTTTPLWRRDSGGNTICNACGLYYKLHNVHRPVTMMRAVIRRRKRVNVMAGSPPLAPQQSLQQQQQQQQQQPPPPPPPPQQQQHSYHQPPPQYHQRLQYPKPLQRPRTPPPATTPVEQSSHDMQGDPGNSAKRRRLQIANGSNATTEEYNLPNRATNGHTDWSRRDQGPLGYRRSISPNEGVDPGLRHSNSPHQGSPYSQQSSRSQDQHGHMYPGQPRYMMSAHHGNGQYHSSPSMSMSRYPTHMPPPPPPRSHHQSPHPPHPSQHPQHSLQQPPPPQPQQHSHTQQTHPHNQTQHHMHQQPTHAYAHSEHSPRDIDDGIHVSSHHSSGWNQRLPGYATVSSSSFNTRLSSTGVVHSGGPPPTSPPIYPRYSQEEPQSPYHHQQHYRGQGQNQQGHEYHPAEPSQSQGGPPPPPQPQGGHHYNRTASPSQGSGASTGSGYAYHHNVSSVANSASNEGHVDRDHVPGGPTHLAPASMSHHQSLPRSSDLLHQQDQGPPSSHHHQFGQHRRQPSSPPIPMNGVVNHVAPAPAPSSAMSGIATSTDVLQQTRQDLQREVSHLSMLLGRAAAVLSGLDQALDRPGSTGSPPVPHAIREGDSPGHGYLPSAASAPHNHTHGHAPPLPQPGSSSISNDVTTNSALASLMALSSSGGPGRSGTAVRHDERDLPHLQPPPPPLPLQQQQLPPPRYPQSYPLPRRT